MSDHSRGVLLVVVATLAFMYLRWIMWRRQMRRVRAALDTTKTEDSPQ